MAENTLTSPLLYPPRCFKTKDMPLMKVGRNRKKKKDLAFSRRSLGDIIGRDSKKAFPMDLSKDSYGSDNKIK